MSEIRTSTHTYIIHYSLTNELSWRRPNKNGQQVAYMCLRLSLKALTPEQVLLNSFPHVNEGMHADLLIYN